MRGGPRFAWITMLAVILASSTIYGVVGELDGRRWDAPIEKGRVEVTLTGASEYDPTSFNAKYLYYSTPMLPGQESLVMTADKSVTLVITPRGMTATSLVARLYPWIIALVCAIMIGYIRSNRGDILG